MAVETGASVEAGVVEVPGLSFVGIGDTAGCMTLLPFFLTFTVHVNVTFFLFFFAVQTTFVFPAFTPFTTNAVLPFFETAAMAFLLDFTVNL